MIGIAFEFMLALGLVLALASSARVGRRHVPRTQDPDRGEVSDLRGEARRGDVR